jgi:hypothetical protein
LCSFQPNIFFVYFFNRFLIRSSYLSHEFRKPSRLSSAIRAALGPAISVIAAGSLFPLAQEEILKGSYRLGRPHPISEEMVFLIDAAHEIFGW